MSIQHRKGFRAIAVFLAFALAQIYIQLSFAGPASPSTPILPQQQLIARLTTSGNQAVNINGNSAISGATVLTGAIIETPPGVSATIDLGPLGTLDIAPGSKIKLEYDCTPGTVPGPENCKAKVTVYAGCVVAHYKKGSNVQIDTEQQEKAAESDKNKKGGGLLNFCYGAPAGAAAVAAGGLPTAAKVAILLAALSVPPALLLAFSGGGGTNPSGTTP